MAFVEKYGNLRHLHEIPAKALAAQVSYYLQHHTVISADKRNKLRVMFNASQLTSSGLSLNDCLHTGEALQMNICTIITRWRTFQYVFTADIVKMFWQILIDSADATWQMILWRRSPEEEVRDLWLLTVTYGTASAPFLALRLLRQLAMDEEQQFPVGFPILLQHMYADEALTRWKMQWPREISWLGFWQLRKWRLTSGQPTIPRYSLNLRSHRHRSASLPIETQYLSLDSAGPPTLTPSAMRCSPRLLYQLSRNVRRANFER